MLDIQTAVQIVISLCVGLSFLAINHYNVFKKIEKFINNFTIYAIVFYFVVLIIGSYDVLKDMRTVFNLCFEIALITFPQFYYSIANYIGNLIDIEKKEK